MHCGVRKCLAAMVLAVALVTLAACSNPGALSTSGADAAAPAAPVYDAWTTPPGPGSPVLAAQPAPTTSWQPAPRPVTPTWSGAGVPPPPPPPPGGAAPAAPYCPPAAAPVTQAVPGRRIVPDRPDDGCGLACEDGISQWHGRLVGGLATFQGTDPAENCLYYGADVGRTFCGCWGLDAYYRYNSGRFDRLTTPVGGVPATVKDGGEFYHVGGKLTFEKAFQENGRLYAWGGLGGGYFWTQKYLFNDDGPEAFGEAGIGFVLNRNWRLRAGVNVHGMDTKVTRRLAANTGQDRWLWIVAPVVEIEGDF